MQVKAVFFLKLFCVLSVFPLFAVPLKQTRLEIEEIPSSYTPSASDPFVDQKMSQQEIESHFNPLSIPDTIEQKLDQTVYSCEDLTHGDEPCQSEVAYNPLFCLSWGRSDYHLDPYRLSTAFLAGDGVGFQGGYTSIRLFAAPYGSKTFHCEEIGLPFRSFSLVPFADLAYHPLFNGEQAATIGLGTRMILADCRSVVGVNFYYDMREKNRLYFHQAGFGLEYLSPCFDLRLNTYFVLGKQCFFTNATRYQYDAGYRLIVADLTTSWSGLDAEIGSGFTACVACVPVSFYAALGPYYYYRQTCGCSCFNTDVVGGRFRLEATVCDYLSLQAEATWDTFWKDRYTITLNFNLPLSRLNACFDRSPKSGSWLEGVARQSVYRQPIIPIYKRVTYDWNWDID